MALPCRGWSLQREASHQLSCGPDPWEAVTERATPPTDQEADADSASGSVDTVILHVPEELGSGLSIISMLKVYK